MSYSGIKIDFLSVGDADAIFVRQYEGAAMTTYLIDGGNKSDSDLVRNHLSQLKITRIDHLVSTHSHADHIDGLIGVVEDRSISIRQAWLNSLSDVRSSALKMASEQRFYHLYGEVNRSSKSEKTLVDALKARNISISEAFMGQKIGGLEVMSPTRGFFDEMKREMVSPGILQRLNDDVFRQAVARLANLGSSSDEAEGGLGEADTTPENQISLVLLYRAASGERCLLTSDAGIKALEAVVGRDAGLGRVKSMRLFQAPHHGSRRNLTHDLIDYFSPAHAAASASGSDKHPSKKVMDAFLEVGAKFHSTHHSKSPTSFNVGNVPS